MKSLHVPFVFYPDVVGGTEVYVAGLAESLTRQHHPVVIAAPAGAASHYTHAGTPVYRFPVAERVADVAELYGEGDAAAAAAFGQILDRERPDVVHLHAFTRACSVLLVRQARSRAIPVVFTYHTPTVSCARGTMMLWGSTPCDGTLRVARCAACALEGRGVSKPVAQLLGHLPPSGTLAAANWHGRAWTAVRFSSLIERSQRATRALFAEVDRIVAFREWVRALLIANGVAAGKIVSSSHALCHPATERRRTAKQTATLRIVFMGRLDPTKGVDLLIRALRAIPDADLVLDVYGTVQGVGGRLELERLRQMANGDGRVVFRSPIDSQAVVDTIAAYDVLAVPSQWMETGPLVVLEAFAAGVPVVGSALGGIAEMVTDGINGLLVHDHRSSDAWAHAFSRLAGERGLLERLARNVEAPKSMDDVATDMAALYESLMDSRSSSTSIIPSVA
jgi:glycosyltransferase involved in cell wall biosynthesis